MGTSALFSLGTRAMSAAYAQLQTTSHNISNASVAGYSRQETKLATADGMFTGAGFFGRGVDVTTVSRAHDELLTREALVTKSQAAADAARLSQLHQLEDAFPLGEKGIGYAAGELLNAFVDVANAPGDTSARQVVLSQAETVAARFRAAGGQVDTIQANVTADLKNSISSVNAITASIAKVNEQIISVNALGQSPNDLLDERDRLISSLSEFVQVTTLPADNGAVTVFTGSGQSLVMGASSTKLVAVQDEYDPKQFHVGIADGASTRTLPDDLMSGGSIGGLLRFQGEDLRDARNLLGRLATAVASSVNEQQALGVNQLQPSSAGTAMYSIGAPQALPSKSNAKDGSGNYAASVSLAVSDYTALQASDYELRADPSGAPNTWQVTRLSDGQATSFTGTTATIDGVDVTIGAPPPAAGDRFLLRPVGAAASEMKKVLADPRGIAAASPMMATTGAANTGTATVKSIAATDPSIDPSVSVDISFTSASGDYSWTASDGSSGTGTWTAGQPISPTGTWALQLDGVPRNGDTLRVERTRDTVANNGNALAFVALGDRPMVGNETVGVAYASAMSEVGVRVNRVKTASEISTAAAGAAETARADKTGVNLDEEAARLIQFQQSYQAAAKMLQVAQNIFDTLLQTTQP